MQGVSDPTGVELLDAAALCRHLVPDGSVPAFLAGHRKQLFPDELFADLFPSGRGRPSVPTDVVATVMVLQALEGLSDREAAAQLKQNIAWKVACGLSLTDPGFHPTVLTLWRARLRGSDRPERIIAAVRQVVHATGVLAGRQRRALDSTLLDDAVATQDTVTQLVAAIRRVRRLVPAAAGLALAAHDYDHNPGKPTGAWDDAEARARLMSALVSDARAVLAAVAGVALAAEQAEAVGLLGLVAGQDVEPGDQDGTWRIARKVAADRPQGGGGPRDQRGRSSRTPHAQERAQLPRRLQGAPGRGARDWADYRGGADPGHHPRRAQRGHGCWPGSRPGWRCWRTRPMAAAMSGSPYAPPAITRGSSPSPRARRCRVASPRTTLSSTCPGARSPARPAAPSP